jgi:hypothetical protein
MAANDTEKGVQTPPDDTNYGIHLSNIDDDAPLPPMDGGMDAWLFLAACFAMEALVWGFAFTYGVFQAYYSEIPQFKDSGNIAVVGTCAMVRTYLLIVSHQYADISRESCISTSPSSSPPTDNGLDINVSAVVSAC